MLTHNDEKLKKLPYLSGSPPGRFIVAHRDRKGTVGMRPIIMWSPRCPGRLCLIVTQTSLPLWFCMQPHLTYPLPISYLLSDLTASVVIFVVISMVISMVISEVIYTARPSPMVNDFSIGSALSHTLPAQESNLLWQV